MAQRDRHAATIERLNERAERWLDLAEQVWHDRVGRVCVVLTVAFLWLTAALVEPAFLLLLAAAAGGLWYRLRHLPVEEPVDDWF
jgi:chromate transport protein ChrA